MSPWMNTREVAEHLRYTGPAKLRSVYRFIQRNGIVPARDGSRVLVARSDVERALAAHVGQRSAASASAKTNSVEAR